MSHLPDSNGEASNITRMSTPHVESSQTETRVTRKGRRLRLAQEMALAAEVNRTTTRVPGAFHDTSRPYGFNHYERIASMRRQQQQQLRQQSAGELQEQERRSALITAADVRRASSCGDVVPQPTTMSYHSFRCHGILQPSIQSIVTAEVAEETENGTHADEEDNEEARLAKREHRKTWVYTANIIILFIVALILVVVLPLQLRKQPSNGVDSESTVPGQAPTASPLPPSNPSYGVDNASPATSIAPGQAPTVSPLPPSNLPSTFFPSQSPRGPPFVQHRPAIMGENPGEMCGVSVEVIDEGWLAYGCPGKRATNTMANAEASGLVRVVDMYNGTQIGQNIVGNADDGFEDVGWALSSAVGGWLAVAGRRSVRLLRYNQTTALWESIGSLLASSDIEQAYFLDTWFISSISLNPFVFGNKTIYLAVTSLGQRQSRRQYSYVGTFTIQVDHQSPEWQKLGKTFLSAVHQEAFATVVAGPRLMVGLYGLKNINMYRLSRNENWMISNGDPRIETNTPVDGLVISHSVTRGNNTENGFVPSTTTVAYSANNGISVVEIDLQSDRILSKGFPIRLDIDSTDPPSPKALYLSSDDWLVHYDGLGAVRAYLYDDESKQWTQQGNVIRLDRGGSHVVRVGLGGEVGSFSSNKKVLVVGLPNKSVLRPDEVFLNMSLYGNKANAFDNATDNRMVSYGNVELYRQVDDV